MCYSVVRALARQCGGGDASPDLNCRRVRIGIGHPGSKERVHGHVLGNYAKSEMDPLADMLAAMAADPILIERPLVETDKGVRLCRPQDTVLEIL